MNCTGYNVLQENGQRVYGPPSAWTGSIPGKRCEVFVSKIPRYLTLCELVPLFQRVGVVYQLRLMVNFSGSNKGFAFVRYSRPFEAERAVIELDGLEIRQGYRMSVAMSTDNCRLFVGGIPRYITEQQLKTSLSEIFEGIEDVQLQLHSLYKTRNRGFAFVEFRDHVAASAARRIAYLSEIKIFESPLNIYWAVPKCDVSQVNVLYVRNLPAHITEHVITRLFGRSSDITRVKKIKNFAFVHFRNREAAELSLHFWNGRQIGDRIINVMWARSKRQLFLEKTMNLFDMNDRGNFSTRNEGSFSFQNHNDYRKNIPVTEPPFCTQGTQVRDANNVQQITLPHNNQGCPISSEVMSYRVHPDSLVDASSLTTVFSHMSVQDVLSSLDG